MVPITGAIVIFGQTQGQVDHNTEDIAAVQDYLQTEHTDHIHLTANQWDRFEDKLDRANENISSLQAEAQSMRDMLAEHARRTNGHGN
jgi:hypothetical protein